VPALSAAGFLIGALVYAAGLSTDAAAAEVPPSVAPGAIERGLQPTTPEEKAAPVGLPAPPATNPPSDADQIRFTLGEVTIDGATAVPADRIRATYAALIGQTITLADLYEVANAITKLYVDAGYGLSFALVPAQQIDASGRVTIAVVEGYVDQITVEGDAPSAEALVREYGAPITAARPLRSADLERLLLLANDLPGFTVKSVFEPIPGAPRGATRLVMRVATVPVEASLEIDNRGSKALGRWRADAEFSIDSLLGLGDQLTLRGLQSLDGRGLTYGAANWSIPVDRDGTTLTLSVSNSSSAPVTPQLEAVDFTGTGWIASAEVEHALVRTREDSLWLSVTATGKWLDSDILSTPNSRDRIYALDSAATYLGHDDGGTTNAVLRLTKGLDLFDATTSSSPLRSRASGSGDYLSVQATLGRLQELGGPFQLQLGAAGQVASRGLLSSEQCGYGGSAFGRGFDDYEIAGDHCLMGSAELRYTPDGTALPGVGLQFYGFADAGEVWQAGALLPGEERSETGRSIGLGLRLTLPAGFSSTLEFAQPLGRNVAQDDNRHGRLFFSIKKSF